MSLSLIVPVATPAARVALTGEESTISNDSSGSATVSSISATGTVRVDTTSPMPDVTIPNVRVPAVAS